MTYNEKVDQLVTKLHQAEDEVEAAEAALSPDQATHIRYKEAQAKAQELSDAVWDAVGSPEYISQHDLSKVSKPQQRNKP